MQKIMMIIIMMIIITIIMIVTIIIIMMITIIIFGYVACYPEADPACRVVSERDTPRWRRPRV